MERVGEVMNRQEIRKMLKTVLKEDQISEKESMKKHTSFRIGGDADFLVLPSSIAELQQLMRMLNEKQIPFFVMGNGTNLLVRDKGIRSVVIKLARNISNYGIRGTDIFAEAGLSLSALSRIILDEELTGFEFASGIPGTVGGAMVMNAGAYGGEMKDIVKSVLVMDEKGLIFEMKGEDMEFGYRTSILSKQRLLVLGATFSLEKGNRQEIQEKMDDYALRRNTKQPIQEASAGSTFKRPEGYFAGKLIEDSGLRGVSHRGAQVSQLHCGFVINKGDATCEDVLELINMIKKTVYDKFQVSLEEEVRLVGEE